MKKLLLAQIGLLLGMAVSARASNWPVSPVLPNYVTEAQITLGASNASPSKVFAFQNTASGQDVIIDRIEVINASTGVAVTSGLMQFWVYPSTSMTHSDTATSIVTHGYGAALAAVPAAVVASTAPLNVQYERDSGILTTAQQNNLTGTSLPIIRPLVINDDETATLNLFDVWAAEAPDYDLPIVLPKGSNRGLVFEKRQVGATDYTAGTFIIRILYTVR